MANAVVEDGLGVANLAALSDDKVFTALVLEWKALCAIDFYAPMLAQLLTVLAFSPFAPMFTDTTSPIF